MHTASPSPVSSSRNCTRANSLPLFHSNSQPFPPSRFSHSKRENRKPSHAFSGIQLRRKQRPFFPLLPSSRPISLSPLNLLLPFQLLHSIVTNTTVLSRLRPKLIVSTGAYVFAPVYFTTIISGIMIMLVIQEQNCYPRITNSALAPYAEKIFLAFNACIKYFPRDKCVVCGNPHHLSNGFDRGVSKDEARLHFFPKSKDMNSDERAQVVLVHGGSTRANAMNLAFLDLCYDMLAKYKSRFIIWQTGAKWFEEVRSVAKVHLRLFLTPFLVSLYCCRSGCFSSWSNDFYRDTYCIKAFISGFNAMSCSSGRDEIKIDVKDPSLSLIFSNPNFKFCFAKI